LYDLCLTQKSGTFTKPFSWCQLWLGWKVWWNQHIYVSDKNRLNTVLKIDGL
jgi:hypothetical protein